MRIVKPGFLFWLILGTGMVYVSCRKTDGPQPVETKERIETRFFNSRPTSNPVILSVMSLLNRKNECTPFVEKTVSQIGYPYWDKAVIISLPVIAGRGAADSSRIIYIPFVRDSENFVNASMAIQVNPADTVIRYLSDWQYRQLPNSSLSLTDSAEKHALFFMTLDNLVFGRQDFIITDTLLFTTGAYRAASVHIEVAAGTSGRNEVMSAPVPVCVNAALSLTQCVTCPGNITLTQCWSEYYGVGTPGGEPPAGGGGSGGGGWAPGGGSSPPSNEPTDSLLKKAALLVNKYRDSLSALCESDSAERFFNIVLSNNVYDTFRVVKGGKGDDVNPNYNIGSLIRKGEWHYHQKYPDGTPGSWPSGADVIKLKDKSNGHVMIVDTYNARYALVVENTTQFAAWQNITGNGPVKFPRRVVDSVNADPRIWTNGASYIQMTKEKLIACLGSAASSGIGLYQASLANGTTFIKVN